MPPVMPAGYYSRFDPTKNYDQHLFRAGKVLQGAELNEVQEATADRVKRIADALFRDGAIIRDAGVIVDPVSGVTQLEGGALYLAGAVRGIAPATLTIPVVGLVQLGAYVLTSVLTEAEDPALRDPATGVRNFNEPGAARLQVVAVWGRAGDGTPGDFYPVHLIQDGQPVPQMPPPQVDAVALAIASYDRESAGGYYVSSGCDVTMLADLPTGEQVYSVAEGIARVNGREVAAKHARRVVYAPVPDLKTVLSEPHIAAGGTERVNLNHAPISTIDQVLINAQKSVTIQHGGFSGAQDALPDSPVLSIVAVNQGGTWNGTSFVGGTTYAAPADYKLTGDKVDWSPSGAEPAPGSTYTVIYRYVASVTPTAVDATGFTVAGAVAGSVTQVSYKWKRPRIDRLCIDSEGVLSWVQGVANDYAPVPPPVPAGLLALASVTQTWTAARKVDNDAISLVPMQQLDAMQEQLDNLFALVSDGMLQTKAALSDPTTKKGVFTDPLNDDTKRDQGTAQTAAVFDGILTLPMTGVQVAGAALSAVATLPLDTAHTAPVIAQNLRTGCMLVNPYQAFDPLPASAVLAPAVDFWTDVQTVWASPITRRFEVADSVVTAFGGWEWWAPLAYRGQTQRVVVTDSTQLVSQRQVDAALCRQISIAFTLTGFGPGETLSTVLFDGRSVPFTA